MSSSGVIAQEEDLLFSVIAVSGFWPCCQRCVLVQKPPAPRLAADLFPFLLYWDVFVVVAVPQGNSVTIGTGSISAELKLSP